MCGIAGYFGSNPPDENRIRTTLERMRRRGPDSCGHTLIGAGDQQALLLHSRLSIIDLSDRANQPLTLNGCTLVFNGEIYNYVELRQELERDGVCFTTSSDTEVLLQAYLRWGIDCLDRFEGMWSFAIFDGRTRTLILSRDRFAEKPMYVLSAPGEIYFGSEVKFLQSLSAKRLTPNISKLIRFMVSGYKTIYKCDASFFAEVHELPYASTMTVQADREPVLRRYWRPTYHPRAMTLQEAIEGTRERLIESVRLRLRADVPLACCLSGGVDSSAIASIAAKIFQYDVETFSIIDTDERYDESDNIRATVEDLGLRNTSLVLTPERGIEPLRQIVSYHDAPLYTISYYVHSILMREVANRGYRVVFSGTGADELFAGYYDHFLLHLNEMRGMEGHQRAVADWVTHIQPLIRNPFLRDPDYYANNPLRREHMLLNSDTFESCFRTDVRAEFSEENYCASNMRNRMLNELFHEGSRPTLHEDDLNAMYYSIENRSPYLDSNLFDFAYSLPSELLIQKGYGKYILREAVSGILNDKVRLDRQKKGFNASVESIFNFTSGDDREYILSDGPIYDFMHRDKIKGLIDSETFPNSLSKFLFSFINCKLFMDEHS
ncbi:MAG: asparagine synthase (glutamine-hydrolyzing) [Humidesulfovibrio sp.]|uniref:asparagine synthase (glutamine-hydrolyzing) n=1 Tax=Humidesulfovibrio sp. TaxID=2910988 RepID=UPI0027FF22BD|nr:asparagine synthase (glutamine-hydrolyzing) [Humidesulfovibrio sp.]MDQ7834248.1 asparagine synthase (glutamine-hydrolyzing) [Humidesulfovibrio sp.]